MVYNVFTKKVPSCDGVNTLCGKVYVPVGEIKALFQVVHGMAEHIDRYDEFMGFMAENGYAVFAYDHVGHGETGAKAGHFGYISDKFGYKTLVDDAYIFAEAVKADFPDKAFYIVKGNCDTGRAFAFNIPVKKTETVDILGKRITLTHGDLYGAKFGTAGLERLALETNADIVVFGHTHRPESLYFPEKESAAADEPSASKSFYLFTPGNIGEGYPLSFGIITLSESGGEPLFSHGQLL